MARTFLTPIDLSKNELQNARLQNLAAAPGSPVLGQFYFDTALNCQVTFNGTIWVPADAAKVTNGYIPIAKLAADPMARANHTGTQTASTINDLAVTVKGYALSDFAAPTVDVPFNSKKITGLLDPTNAQDGATKNYVDAAVQSSAAGIDSKASVRLLAVANVAALSGLTAIDGVTPAIGDRVLLTAQTTGSQNGVYVAASGAWSRALDADQNNEITPGAFWFVEEGTTYSKTQWRCNNSGGIVVGTTSITIVQFGATLAYTGGNGLVLTGGDFAVGAGTGIVVGADNVAIDTAVVTRKYSANVGDAAAVFFVVTHNLGTTDVTVAVYRNGGSFDQVECDIEHTSTNTITVRFAAVPSAAQFRVVVHG